MKIDRYGVWRQSAHRFGEFIIHALVIALLVVLLYVVVGGPKWIVRVGEDVWTVQKVESE